MQALLALGVAKTCDFIYIRAPAFQDQKEKKTAIKDTKRLLKVTGVMEMLPPELRRKLDSC